MRSAIRDTFTKSNNVTTDCDERGAAPRTGRTGDVPGPQPPVVSWNPSTPACTSSGGAFHFCAVLASQGATTIAAKVRAGSGGTGPSARHRPALSTIV